MTELPTKEEILKLMEEVKIEGELDWSQTNIDLNQLQDTIATQVLEQYNQVPEENRLIVAVASSAKLLLENFVLHLKLGQKK